MTITALQSLKRGDHVELMRGRLKGVRAVVSLPARDGKGSAVRLTLPSGSSISATAGALRIAKG